MNNYCSRLIHFAEVLLPAYRRGETLEAYDPTREMWVNVDPELDAISFGHYLTREDQPEEFWELRIAQKPEPKIPDVPVFWISFGDRSCHLVHRIENDVMYFPSTQGVYHEDSVSLRASENVHWSRDRKNWFDFYGRAVK